MTHYLHFRLGYVDVVHYLVVRGHADPHIVDVHDRTAVFTAVMHKQPDILQYFLTRVSFTHCFG